MQKSIENKQSWIKRNVKKLVIGFVTLNGGLIAATTFSFADTNLPAAITSWTSQQIQQSNDYIIGMTEAESTKQKARLIEEVQLKAMQSAEEIQRYAIEKSAESQEELQQYGDKMIQQIDEKSDKDVEATKEKIDEIIQNAMDQIKETAENPDGQNESNPNTNTIKPDSTDSESNIEIKK